MAAFTALAIGLALLARKPPVLKPTPKRGRGRPKKADPQWWDLPAPKKRGAPVKITPDDEQWFLAEIDSWKSRVGGEGGIRTPVPVTRQDAFEEPPLRPLRYISGRT